MKTIHLMLCVLAITLTACDTNDDSSSCESSLPPATTTGANTFGACIDGKLLIPRSGGGSFGTAPSAFSLLGALPNLTDYEEIEIRDLKSNRTSRFLIHIENAFANDIGSYIINQSNGQNGIDGFSNSYIHCRIFDDKTGQYQYYLSYENSGSLTLTKYNFDRALISGTFNCWLKNSSNQNDSIQINNGRFDINGVTLPNTSFP